MGDAHSLESIDDYLARPFRLDLRSLALLRVGLGLLLIADLVNRGLWLRAHYTDFGVMPRQALLETRWDPAWLSIHLLSGQFWPTLVLFVVAALAALALVVGYRTTIATVVSWFLLISLHARNPMVLQGGDIAFRLFMFWAMFLPLGARWSVDAALDPDGEPDGYEANQHFGTATVAYVAQIAFIYVFSAILKDSPEWRSEFTAVYQALSLDQFTTPLGDWLWARPDFVLEALTAATMGLEAGGWALLFVPLLTLPWFERSDEFFRIVAIVLFVGMHMSFAVTMRLGLFSYIVSLGWLALLPAWFWERIGGWFGEFGDGWEIRIHWRSGEEEREYALERRGSESTLDAIVRRVSTLRTDHLRETGVRLLRGGAMLPRAELTFADEADDETPWVVVGPDGREYPGTEGVARLLRLSPVLGPLYRAVDAMATVDDWLRAVWARCRRSGALRAIASRMFSIRPYRVRESLVGSALAAFALMGVFWWNMQTVDARYGMTQPWRRLTVYARLDQKWNMFAPHPLKEDGWYVIPGELRNGERVSLFQKPHREPPEWEKPADVSATYPNQRWRKYMMNIWMSQYSDQRLYYGRYLCRRWNSEHTGGEMLVTFKIYFMEEPTRPNHVVPEAKKRHLWTHNCFEDPDDEGESGGESGADALENLENLPTLDDSNSDDGG